MRALALGGESSVKVFEDHQRGKMCIRDRAKPLASLLLPDVMTIADEVDAQLTQTMGDVYKRQYAQGGKKMPGAAGDQERRLQRLQAILDELVALTDGGKL